jgi:hypothetical protein
MNKRALTALASLGLLLGAAGAGAVPAISDTDGWGGHVNIGAGVASSETNMVASLSSLDLGDDRISTARSFTWATSRSTMSILSFPPAWPPTWGFARRSPRWAWCNSPSTLP